MKSVIKQILAIGLLLSTSSSEGTDWGRFRGPNGSGVATAGKIPVDYVKTDAVWETTVDGNGNSSPIIAGGNVYLTVAEIKENTKEGARSLLAYSLRTGKLQWKVTSEFTTFKTNKRNGFASASPCADQDGVYVLWQSERGSELKAFDHEGRKRWEYEIGAFGAGTGAATSPIVYDSVVLLSHDNENYESFLLAVSAKDGSRIWQTGRKTQRTGYATPAVFKTSDGQTQVVFSHSYEGVVGVDFETGKIVWQNVVFGEHTQRAVGSPIVAGDQVIAASGFTNGIRTLVSLKPDRVNGLHEASEHFRTTRNVPHCPTPLVLESNLYCWTDRGILACLDLNTGKQKWLARVGGEYFSSPIALGRRILCIDRNGTIVVVGAGDQYQELGRSELEVGVMATPGLTEDAIIIRTENSVMRFDLEKN
ncbi:MAG: PQQ-binding-like beta-propeller repeat protein [Planctomycetota bacterium]|nr:PQQ-binding-like beta-propeller repeat protein [Planctomycetota bacterium]